ncbi:hypothetical protein PVAND_012275 [Polypedilum vanderplanki]|uniref:HTH CENPB-type domain-containing protein n=1 Tax=Polypedilum vanderplanki TaxID=319348 RepID=A0A9J6CM82_POLVA|nr:hypothetical protein PVAND_012275 [Polypedilum vanderplanki]
MSDKDSSVKRKRVVLTLEEKLEVIALKEQGTSLEEISRIYKIGSTTIKDITKNKKKIKEAVDKQRSLGFDKSRKTLTAAKRPAVEIKLYDWISEQLDNNQIVTNKDILTKAHELSVLIYKEDWKASKGWLNKFKVRYNLTGTKFEKSSIENEETLIYESKPESPEKIEAIDEEEHIISEQYTAEDISIELTPLYAADFLLNYVSSNGNFPLKEIITLQMIRDRIANQNTNKSD